MQKIYAERFPELVGAGTSEATTKETTEESTTTIEETTEETIETTILAPVIQDIPEEIIPEVTEQINVADAFEETDPVYFLNSHPLQTISHEERDVKLDVLKQQVQDFITNNPNERISFRYVNLSSNETLGINDLTPILPGASIALPIELVYYSRVSTGYLFPRSTATYYGEVDRGGSSFIADTYAPGKPFYLRTLANLAISQNDNIALSYIINALGGDIPKFWPYVADISNYINFTSNVTYTNSNGDQVRGDGRTSCYDMAEYASFLYFGYKNDPELYQPMINDMASSTVFSPYRTSFGEDALILHVAGRNEDMNSYTDVAIIDCEEPIVLVINCECSNYERGVEIQTILSNYVAQYISSCHTNP